MTNSKKPRDEPYLWYATKFQDSFDRCIAVFPTPFVNIIILYGVQSMVR